MKRIFLICAQRQQRETSQLPNSEEKKERCAHVLTHIGGTEVPMKREYRFSGEGGECQ